MTVTHLMVFGRFLADISSVCQCKSFYSIMAKFVFLFYHALYILNTWATHAILWPPYHHCLAATDFLEVQKHLEGDKKIFWT